jgi:hypothetical protein
MIKGETIERAQRVFAMLNVLQYEIDELECDGAFFKHKLKMKGKQFASELEKQIADFYDAMNDEANLYYNEQIKSFEALIHAYTHNQIEILPDK